MDGRTSWPWGGEGEGGGESGGEEKREEMGAAWLGDRNAIGGRGGKKTGRQAILQTTHCDAINITAKNASIQTDTWEYSDTKQDTQT